MNTQSGKEILEAVKSLRGFCEDVGRLLQTASDQMSANGWKRYNNVAIAGASSSLLSPHLWIPQAAFCFFMRADSPSLLALISVVIDDLESKALIEPHVVCGILRYNQSHGDHWGYEWAKQILLVSDAMGHPGEFKPVKITDLDPEGVCDLAHVEVMARQLVSIQHSGQILEDVVTPLLAKLAAPSVPRL